MKIALTIPGIGEITSGLPTGVPTGDFEKFNSIISVFIEFAFVAAIGFALYVIAHAAFNMITSGGDKERFAQGRERLRYAIIGLLVMFFSFFIISLIGNFFGIQLIKLLPHPSASCTNGIYCAGTCYTQEYIDANYPAPLCGAECTDLGLRGKACPDTFPGCAGIGDNCEATPCCENQGTVCSDVFIPSKCILAEPTVPIGPSPSISTQPTPTPQLKKPGETITITTQASNTPNNPVKRMVDLVFTGGNSSYIRAEIRVAANIGTVLQEGQEFFIPENGSEIITTLIIRPGASPTCFDTITYNLFSREPGATSLPIDTKILAENFCIPETLTALVSHRNFNGKNTVYSDIQLFNFSPITQKTAFSIDTSGCFPASDRQFLINNVPTSPDVLRTISANRTLNITMLSTVPTGSIPPFNCSATIQRLLE